MSSDDWLEVPEPGEREANFLIEVRDGMEFALKFAGFDEEIPGVYGDGMSTHFGTVTVDWGALLTLTKIPQVMRKV